jgi:hypothetical protein
MSRLTEKEWIYWKRLVKIDSKIDSKYRKKSHFIILKKLCAISERIWYRMYIVRCKFN